MFLENSLKKILNTENKINIAKNSGWLILDHGIKIIFGLLIGAWVARYLGPADYGTLNYVIAVVTILAPLYILGLNATVPKELIHREDAQEKILGSAFLLKFIGSILIFLLAVVISIILHPEDEIILLLALFIGLSYVFKSFDAIDIWFLNKLKSKYSVIALNSGLIISAMLKIALIVGGFSLVYFGFAVTVEAFIMAIALIILFIKTEPLSSIRKIKFNFKESFNLLKISWIYVFLNFLNLAILNTDKIMLKNMLSFYEVGLYSISAMITFSLILIGNSIVKSVYPVLIQQDKDKPFEKYSGDFQRLFNYLALLAYGIIVLVFLSSGYIIPFLWGKEYLFSVQILYIQIFSILFVFLGFSLRQWMVMKNLTKFFLITLFLGFGVNLVLNYFLILKIGISGAAYATVITFFIVYIVAGLFNCETRKFFKMQLRALFLVDYFKIIYNKLKFISK